MMYCLVSDMNKLCHVCSMLLLPKLTLRRVLSLAILFTSVTLLIRYIIQLEEAFVEAPFCKVSDFEFTSQPPRFGIPPLRSVPSRVGPTPGNTTDYVVLYNYLSPAIFEEDKLITLTTHATPEFLFDELIDLVHHWPTHPLSIAVTPSNDPCATIAILSWLWKCKEEIKNRVTFHLILKDTETARFLKARPLLEVECSVSAFKNVSKASHHRIGAYMINVARNVARTSALTHYVLASDIELLPSQNLARNFERFAQQSNWLDAGKVVFVVPTFEIEASESGHLPRSHQELAKLYKNEKVVYFHALVCKKCQNFPKLKNWINSKLNPGDDGLDDKVNVFTVAKREVPFHRWEPIFIGTNAEPLYDERLSWDGYQDKMTQMHELCLEDYKFAILDTAFLLHRPGIKRHKDKSKEELRSPHIKKNSMVYAEIMAEMRERFNTNKTNCKEHN